MICLYWRSMPDFLFCTDVIPNVSDGSNFRKQSTVRVIKKAAKQVRLQFSILENHLIQSNWNNLQHKKWSARVNQSKEFLFVSPDRELLPPRHPTKASVKQDSSCQLNAWPSRARVPHLFMEISWAPWQCIYLPNTSSTAHFVLWILGGSLPLFDLQHPSQLHPF